MISTDPHSPESLAFRLDEIVRLLSRKVDAALLDHGLTRTQWKLLAYVAQANGPTQTELARLLDMERATIGQAVDAMEKRGLVRREPVPHDRRVWRILPTVASDALTMALRPVVDQLMQSLFAGFDTVARTALSQTLMQLVRNLEDTLPVPQHKAPAHDR